MTTRRPSLIPAGARVRRNSFVHGSRNGPGQALNTAWSGLSGPFFPAFVAEMLHQGFAPAEVVKIGGGNFCRVFDEVTAGRA